MAIVALRTTPVGNVHRSLRQYSRDGVNAIEVVASEEHSSRCSGWNLACYTWDTYRAWSNSVFTTIALAWGTIHGGKCTNAGHDFFVCTEMPGGYGGKGGVAVGNVYLTGDPSISAGEFKHEQKHADQWAMLGSGFITIYASSFYGSEAYRGDQCANLFEWWAGFEDGYYDC
jgi:hypothetical protein